MNPNEINIQINKFKKMMMMDASDIMTQDSSGAGGQYVDNNHGKGGRRVPNLKGLRDMIKKNATG